MAAEARQSSGRKESMPAEANRLRERGEGPAHGAWPCWERPSDRMRLEGIGVIG